MTNETLEGLERLSWMPDREEGQNGLRIAGQYYYDVEFTGGAISNVTLTDVTINGTATSRTERVITASGGVTVASDDYVITMNKTVSATTTITLPASPATSRSLIIKDGKGDAASFNITINGNGKNIDGSATYVLSTNYGAVEIIYNGTQWNKIGQYTSATSVTSVNGQTGVVVLTTSNISEGSNLYFTVERSQDATGAMVDSTLIYNDASNGLGRAAIIGDVTISAGSNTAAIGADVIVNADINASAAIDSSKIADGSVSNTEFQYLGNVTSAIQTQFSGKQGNVQYQDEGVNKGTSGGLTTVNFVGGGVTASNSGSTLTVTVPAGGGYIVSPGSSTDNAVVLWDSALGDAVQNSVVIIDPATGNTTGFGSLAASGPVTLGANSGTSGQVKLFGSTSGDATIKVAAAAGTGTVFQLPADNGTNAYVLQTNGSGVTSWAAAATGGIGGSTGSTDNAILRANGTGGNTAQASLVTISDTGQVFLPDETSLVIGGSAFIYRANASGLTIMGGGGRVDLYTAGSMYSNISDILTSVWDANGYFVKHGYQLGFADVGSAGPDVAFFRIGAAAMRITDGGAGYGDLSVLDEAYGSGWNGSLEVPTKNAIYDKIETLGGGIAGSTGSTDNAMLRADGTGGATLQASVNVVADTTGMITTGPAGGLQTTTTDTNTFLLRAYDVDGTAYKTFATLTAGNTPSMAITTPAGGTITIDGSVIGGTTAAAGTFTTSTANSFIPNSSSVPSNGMYLPAANTLGWAINSAAELQLTGTALSPAADGGSSLGTTALGWQNIFGNTGFVFNIENGDWVATHTSGVLTVGTGDLRVTNAGANTASVMTLGGTQTAINKTFTSPILTTPSAFTTGGTITLAENTSIALDPAGSADGKYSGITIAATSGYTQAFGDLVYLDPTDSRWEAVDANSAAGADGDARGMIGMVVSTGTDGNACIILLQGVIRADAKFPSFTINNPIYASETAAAVTQTQPTTTDVVIRVVGFSLTADEMYFNPSQDYVTHV